MIRHDDYGYAYGWRWPFWSQYGHRCAYDNANATCYFWLGNGACVRVSESCR